MSENDLMPVFTSDKERTQWILQRAVYFTAIRRKNLRNERHEYLSLALAKTHASAMAKENNCNYLIYAVGPMDYSAYVKTIRP